MVCAAFPQKQRRSQDHAVGFGLSAPSWVRFRGVEVWLRIPDKPPGSADMQNHPTPRIARFGSARDGEPLIPKVQLERREPQTPSVYSQISPVLFGKGLQLRPSRVIE